MNPIQNSRRFGLLVAALAVTHTCQVRAQQGGNCPMPNAVEDLQAAYPGLQAYLHPVACENVVLMALYGQLMNSDGTAEGAAEAWLEAWAEANSNAFGVEDLALELDSSGDGECGNCGVFAYRQIMEGTLVEDSRARLVVRDGTPQRVAYVGARLAPMPAAGLREAMIDGQEAIESAQSQGYSHLTEWSEPQQAVFFDESTPAVRTWKFAGRLPDGNPYEAYTFFVDVFDASLVHVRSEVYDGALQGRVTGKATPGMLPDTDYNPPAPVGLPKAGVWLLDNPRVAGEAAFTDDAGRFAFPYTGTGPARLRADLFGQWATVIDDGGDDVFVEQWAGPAQAADVLLNPSPLPGAFSTAQVNVLIYVTRTHDFYKSRQPCACAIDVPLQCRVNLLQTHCNAQLRLDPVRLEFQSPNATCVNTAYSSWITHEYGHFILHTREINGGAFGEGFSDALAVLVHDDPVVGRDYLGPGQHLRDFDVLDQQYPCTDTRPHECGKVLAGCWWDIKTAMQKLSGAESGLEVARQLFTEWSRWATGGSGTDSAHPGTVIEVLGADDERYGDDDISNGTPHDCAICQGFWAHHLPCPAVLLEGDNCDGDGVPDRCSGDCNENATPDACDVFAATSTDCDSDGVPDECSGDCNDNAIYDACDIDVGTSEDCDGDGTPDECESDADCTANAVPDRCDVAGGTSRDCDASGVPDECEVSAGTSADCNENGTPDGCEPDCNASGFPDDCDVTAGTSADCGGDGVPDECTAADCNANSVPDECDIASGTAEDCNGNRVPDTCDLTGGTSGDCPAAAGNGVPDECEPDCNRNGTADSCDLATESSPDCDGNGTPDECDLVSCQAHDCNGNGILDTCDLASGTSVDGNEDGVPDECAVPPVIMTVTSVGHHKEFGDWGGGEVELCVDPELGAIEPRIQFPIAANDNTWLFLRVTFDQAMDADSLTVAGVVPTPGLDAEITQPQGSPPESIEIRFKNAGVAASVPAGSYAVNLSGLASLDTGTRAGGTCATFRICYATGDVNCDGRATFQDLDVVSQDLNRDLLPSK